LRLALSLLGIFATVLVVLWAWSRWQLLRARKAAGETRSDDGNSLIRTTRVEPRLLMPDTPLVRPAPLAILHGLDRDTECVAILTADAPLEDVLVKSIASQHRTVGRHTVRYAIPRDAINTLHIGLTLADRRGAISQADLETFMGLVDDIADQLQANVEVESADQALGRAQMIDAQCALLDTQIHLHLSAARVPHKPAVDAALMQFGFDLNSVDGPFELHDESGGEIARIALRQGSAGAGEAFATIVVDLPRVPQHAFEIALKTAQELAISLDAVVVDDNGKSLSDTALALVRARLTDVSRKMEQSGMPPGSERARRLFS
jgi:hypothetical protein